METVYIYFLKASIALILFYGFYRLVIFQNTFFKVRRFTLLAILFFSALYPFIDIVEWLSRKEPVHEILIPYIEESAIVVTPIAAEPEKFSVSQFGMIFYGVIAAILFLRMFIQFLSILFLRYKSQPVEFENQRIYVLADNPVPFSFFHWIFMNPEHTSHQDSIQILTHEQTHARQYHSLDLLISELATVFFWFNPFVWLLKQEIRVNLEHLADNEVIERGAEVTTYQYSLLRLCHQKTSNKLVNNFNIPQFKRRIIMMNKNKSNRNSLLRYAFLIPVAGLLVVSGNVQAVISKVRSELTAVSAELQDSESKVSGQVLTADNQPVAGANVIIKNTHIGTVTDANGKFSLEMKPGDQLHISFVGLKSTVVTPELNQKELKIILDDAPVYQEEVVVVGYGEAKKDKSPVLKDNSLVFTVVEEMPSFPGGENALMQYIARSIKYPVIAQENGIEGMVFVSYIINADGKITSPEVIRSADPALDKEALRIITGMPDWNPGKQRGKPVAVKYVLPITFRLQKNEEAAPAGKGLSKGLIIVDGKEQAAGFDLHSIAPDRIESVQVIKDAALLQKYGDKGANGVIEVKLKP
ncbi:MAG: TonB family protein [Bacteroidales bacterium]